MNRIKLGHRLLIPLALLLLNLPTTSRGQFIQPPGGSDEIYENYASELYKSYSQELQTVKYYDDFGNYLVEGVNVFLLDQPRPGSGSVIKYKYYRNYFNNLVISQDTYKNFATSLIIGDAIRTKFTSLSLDMARFNGIRWDGATRKNQFSILSSRLSAPIIMPIEEDIRVDLIGVSQNWPRYLMGGHWKTELGDVLHLGATYLNLSQVNGVLQSKQRNFFKGDVTESQPTTINLRFADDSPKSDYGAMIFEPPSATLTYESDGTRKTMEIEAIPERPVTYPLQVNGKQSFDFSYPIPAELKTISVDFAAVVANDFRISCNHAYARDPLQPDSTWSTFYKVFKRARGDVHDQSNKQIVHINYSLDTGISIYGIDFQANLLGLEIAGEYLINTRNSKYPLLPGNRYDEKHSAWYLHLKRRMGLITVGGEVFHIDADYAPSLDLYSLEASYYPYGPADTTAARGVHDWLVDDNDDNDRYADGWFQWSGATAGQPQSLNYHTNDKELWNPDNPKPDAGIFPGLDENNDGIPDDDQNTNGIADYNEYFMMYFRDPPRFDFGDDWNNNLIIDNREDDQKPDQIYDQDLKGNHIFLSMVPIRNSVFTLGRIRQEQIAGAGHNSINYGKFEYQLNFPRYGKAQLYHVTKQVKDNIPDPTYQVVGETYVKGSVKEFTPDPLAEQNSHVHTTYLGTQYLGTHNLNVENKLKNELNRQRKTGFQDKATISYWGGVHKIDYTFRPFSNFSVTPQFKYRWEWGQIEQTNDKSETWIHQYWTMPILRMDYTLTPRTVLRAGIQGDPFFLDDTVIVHRFRNKLDPSKSENARIFKVMVIQSSDYFGYKIYFNAGFEIQRISYLENEEESEDYSSMFFRILAGW
ncbi:hypothetical protein KAX22_06700 [bacterium]|nr:hypothetical protein [bacterium]